jgi:YD repeat-containing protein
MKKKFGLFVFLWILASSIALWAQTQSRRTYIYDETRQLIGVIDEEGNRLSYIYDAAGNLISIDRLSARGAVDIFFLEPSRGRAAVPPQPGTPVTIHGVGFSAVAAENQVTFNGVAALVESATNTMIRTSVPAGATTGLVRVTIGKAMASSRSDFIVISGIVVTVSPARVDVGNGQRQQFTATVTEAGRQISNAVTWSVSPAVGTITGGGVYTAPATLPPQPTVTVTATSIEDPTARGTATIDLVLSLGPIFDPGASYQIGTAEEMTLAPIFDPGGSYQIGTTEEMTLAPIFDPGASYQIGTNDEMTLAPIFDPGASYTTILITGLDPNRVLRGTMNIPFTVTGKNFNGATALDFLLPEGDIDTDITVANLTVNPDGTQITARITVADEAEVGARTVVVRTPVGPSATMATDSNQLVIE